MKDSGEDEFDYIFFGGDSVKRRYWKSVFTRCLVELGRKR